MQKKPPETERLFSFEQLGLFHHNLLHGGLRTRGQAQEVNALGHATDVDLSGAASAACGHLLAHAVEHRVAELGVAAVDGQGAAGGVGIDTKLGHFLSNAPFRLDDDAFR